MTRQATIGEVALSWALRHLSTPGRRVELGHQISENSKFAGKSDAKVGGEASRQYARTRPR
jgi:hypothetical protein